MEHTRFSLRSLRLSRGISQAELARRIGVHRATIINWENNTNSIPLGKFRSLCEVLDLEISLVRPERHMEVN